MTPPVTPEAGRWPDADRVAPAVFAWADVTSTGDAVCATAPSAGGSDATTPAAGPGGDSPDPVSGDGPDAPPPERPRLETLRKRADFLRAARAGRARVDAFTLQARRRDPEELSKSAPAEQAAEEAPGGLIRVGYTCSKKVGNAVARNRAKRRLREAA
ncbi:ribonuclease P protein component, partial [Brevirhabdus pacifica]|uniref:ribonuclease P protein component n=1 Tax=Brevirhabdus pacifica TaxID=1267768 RepID=UPI000A118F16